MCFHKYTHYLKCTLHIPLHTHVCPKNVADDASRVIFCENYQAIRVDLNEACPFCTRSQQKSNAAAPAIGRTNAKSQDAYPSPAHTVTP